MGDYHCPFYARTPGPLGIRLLQRVKTYLGKYITVKAYDTDHMAYETTGFLSGILDYPVFTIVLARGNDKEYICLKDVIEIININGRSFFGGFGK